MATDWIEVRSQIETLGPHDNRITLKPRGPWWLVDPYRQEYPYPIMLIKFMETDGLLLPSDIGRIASVFEYMADLNQNSFKLIPHRPEPLFLDSNSRSELMKHFNILVHDPSLENRKNMIAIGDFLKSRNQALFQAGILKGPLISPLGR